MKLPISVYTTITVQDLAILNSPADITAVAIGTSPNRPRITDTQLHKAVATYPAYAMIEDGKLIIYTAMEYGTSLGVYEMGVYAGDTLVATINQKSRYEINKPIFNLRHDRTYIFDVRLDLGRIDGVRNRGALELVIDERDDITYPMAMAIQHNSALSAVASEQVNINTSLANLTTVVDEHGDILKEHQGWFDEIDASNHTQAQDIDNLKQENQQSQERTQALEQELQTLKQSTENAMQEAQNKVRLKSRHERLLVMHDYESNGYELTLTDVAKASVLSAEIIERQDENAKIREEIEQKIVGKLDERQVRALIAEAELDDVSRDEIKLKIIEAVAGKMTDERVTELLAHKLDVLDAERLLAQKASLAYVAEQIAVKDKELSLKLEAKVDDDAFAEMLAILAQKGDRLEVENKIKAVNEKAIHNHLLIDELTKNQATSMTRLEHLGQQLERAPNEANIIAMRADIADLQEKWLGAEDVMANIAQAHINKLTEGASGAMDTFAEVEAALANGDSVAAGILNHINTLKNSIDKLKEESAKHRQFTGFKTATNLTQIVAIILDEGE